MRINFLKVIIALALLRLGYEMIRRYLISTGHLRATRQRERENEAKYVRSTLSPCAVCQLELMNHQLFEVVCVREPDQDKIEKIDSCVRNHDWLNLVTEYSLDSQFSALAYFFIQCPKSGGGTLYRMVSRAGFDDNDEIRQVEVLSGGAASALLITLNRKPPLAL